MFFAEQQGKKQKPGMDLATLTAREWRKEVSEDAHLRRVFLIDHTLAHPLDTPPGETGFATLALEVFGPLLEHLSTFKDEA